MPLPQSLRSGLTLIIGLIVGIVGATLFRDSLLGDPGSPEERANRLEVALKQAENRIAALEASDSPDADRGGVLQRLAGPRERRRLLDDGARDIFDDLRAGRPVTPEQLFSASQPFRELMAPLFDRIRVRQQQQMIDSLTGEFARKYDLSPEQQTKLKQWFLQKSDEEGKRWSEFISKKDTRLQDVIRASQNARPDQGIEEFMPQVLSGETLAKFQTERLNERALRVEQEADMRVQRLDNIVGLTDAQRDQVFAITARSSKDYDPRMVLEGVGTDVPTAPAKNVNEAMLSVLTPDQRAAYEEQRLRRREQAAKDLEAIGLALPHDWDMFNDDFR